ncbi:MAG: AI-2E family transporter [Anaeromyxobacter sp.]
MPPAVPIWRRPRAQLVALTVVLWLLVVTVGVAARAVLLPFVLAALLAYVIDPVIVRLSRLRLGGRPVPRWVAVLVVYAVLALVGWLLAISIVPQAYRESVRALQELRDFLAGVTPERIDDWAHQIDAFLQRYGVPIDVVPGDGTPGARLTVDLAAGIAGALHDLSAGLRGRVGDVVEFTRLLLSGAFRAIFFVFLLFMLTAFMSMDAPRILRFFDGLVPRTLRPDWRRLLHGIDAGLAGVVRGQLTIMLVNGLLTLVGLVVLKVPFAFALALLATVLYVVPIFGTVLSSIPIILVALVAGGPGRALLALGWIGGIHALEAYFLNPKIMGTASKIDPVLIVLALVAGEQGAGIPGALLAVPVMSIFVAVFRFLHRKQDALDASSSPPSDTAAQPAPAPTAPVEKGNTP